MRTRLVLAAMLLALIAGPAPVAAHAYCGGVTLVVFADTEQKGASDYWCSNPPDVGRAEDDRFDANDLSVHDVGQTVNMHDRASSYSVTNSTSRTVCVKIYPNEYQGALTGGPIKEITVSPGQHRHVEQGFFDNDSADSAATYRGSC
jgi:hypothetical protein